VGLNVNPLTVWEVIETIGISFVICMAIVQAHHQWCNEQAIKNHSSLITEQAIKIKALESQLHGIEQRQEWITTPQLTVHAKQKQNSDLN
jgi:hypothetical protein